MNTRNNLFFYRNITRTGFTLIEIIITAVVIGILAAIMIPQYTKYVEAARGEQARLMLKSIRAAQKIYRSDNGRYTRHFSDLADHMTNPNSDPNRAFRYRIRMATSTRFTARAIRLSGKNRNERMEINHNGTFNPSGGDSWSP